MVAAISQSPATIKEILAMGEDIRSGAVVISTQDWPQSVLRQMPQWCCTQKRSGAEGHCTIMCGSWVCGSSATPSGPSS